ncbi:MAG: DUF4389 domain-containing protein [Cellvibrionales bacterium]|nr:DUF4389 domain-containing protein [Cellvibrionales bacterium]
MTDQSKPSIRHSLLNKSTWLRLLLIAVFYWLVLMLLGWVLGAIILVQAVLVLFSGTPNQHLSRFAANLSTYFRQIVLYCCFVRDEKPFPFREFPSEDLAADESAPSP